MAGKTANADLVALYNSEKVQNYLPEYQLGVTAAPDVSALSTYIETVSVVFGGNTNSVAFKLVPTAALAGAGYTLAVDMTGATLREIDGVYYINGVHAHYFDNEFTISIKNGEEVVASAKYSLGGYLYSIQSSADANLKAFIQAAWLYCSAISDIKNY